MRRKIIGVVLTLSLLTSQLIPFSVQAQVQEISYNQGAAAAWQALIKLRTTATVLFTQAHPDDEDAGLVTWVARHEGARTGILSLTRGEGGANLIGSEQYDALGILRTEEFLAACRYYGADLMFTRMADFGYSKRLGETLEHWGKENVLRDMVRAVRTYKPDIIISRFHGKARDGHGNHQAAGLLSFEVFKAAADPKVFPEEGASWQVKKLYLSTRGNEPSTLKINTGEYDPLLGKSYPQIGSEGYGMHRSQAMGQQRIPTGDFFSTLQLAESAIPKIENEQSIFDGIDTTLTGLAKQYQNEIDLRPELNEAANAVEIAISKFNAREPWTIAEELASGKRNLYKAIDKVTAASIDSTKKNYLLFLLDNKKIEFNNAMNSALGMKIEVVVEPEKPTATPIGTITARETFTVANAGQNFAVRINVVNLSPTKLGAGETVLLAPQNWKLAARAPEGKLPFDGSRFSVLYNLLVPNDVTPTRPHWTRVSELRDHQYQISAQGLLNSAFAWPEVSGGFKYQINGVSFVITELAQTAFIARPYGAQRRLLTVAPTINVLLSPHIRIIQVGKAATTTVSVNLSSNAKGKVDGTVRLRLPQDWFASPVQQDFSFSREGEKGNFTFTVAIPKLAANQDYKIQAIAEYKGKEYTEGYEVIAHPDLEPRHLYHNATMDIRGVDVQVAPNLHVGYVMGTGDKVPEALAQIGVKVTMLGANELATGNFDQFDAIVIGIRASAVREDLKANNKRLLEYVERGGNVIWQYQTPEFDEANYGPYPYKMARNPEEVSEEDSKVTILDATNPIFNFPNKITPADFDNWVEERGSKWWGEWDTRYKPLLESHDREQALQKGGMMYAEYGKGTWIYAGYAFYRQLPAGVQGGYRLFANLLSLKKRPGN